MDHGQKVKGHQHRKGRESFFGAVSLEMVEADAGLPIMQKTAKGRAV
jgi:hypothetical protein